MDRGRRIIIDKTARVVTMEYRRWFFGGKRFTLPLSAITAVTIDVDEQAEVNSYSVSMVTIIRGREHVEVYRGQDQRVRSVGTTLGKLLEVKFLDYP